MTRAQMKERLAYSFTLVVDSPKIWWLSSMDDSKRDLRGIRKNMFNGLYVTIVNEVFFRSKK